MRINHGMKLHQDGTLEITMPKGVKIGRVLVCEAGTQNGSLYYPEEPERKPGHWVGIDDEPCDVFECDVCGTKTMTAKEAVNWIINIMADIGKAEHRDLWHYEQALSEIKEMLESQPERKKGKWIDYSEDGFVECPFCHSATNCDGNKDELHYCFSCGADMRGEQDG